MKKIVSLLLILCITFMLSSCNSGGIVNSSSSDLSSRLNSRSDTINGTSDTETEVETESTNTNTNSTGSSSNVNPDAPNTPLKVFKSPIEKRYSYDQYYKYFPSSYKFDFTKSNTEESYLPKVEEMRKKVVDSANTMTRQKNSVKNFGAVGDGVTDDTAAIMKAYKDLKGKIYFPAGKYLLRQTLVLQDDTVIYGDHAQLILNDDISGITGDAKTNIYIKGIYINKKWIDNSTKYGILFISCANIVVDNCEVSGFGGRAGISLRTNCNWFSVTNNFCHDFSASKVGALDDGLEQDSFGFETRWGTKNGVFRNNVVDNIETREPNRSARLVQTDGFYIGGNTENVLIEGNYVSRVGEGFDLGHARNIIIRNNTIVTISIWGIKVGQGSTDVLAEKNYIEDSGFGALHAYSGQPQNGDTNRVIYRQNFLVDCNRSNAFPKRSDEHLAAIHFAASAGAECMYNTAEYNAIYLPPENKNVRWAVDEGGSSQDNYFRYNYIEGTFKSGHYYVNSTVIKY